MSTHSFGRTGLRGVVVLAACALAAPLAWAAEGDADVDAAATQSAAVEEPALIEEVTVTGSRIQQQKGMTTATPVASLSLGEISEMAPGPIVESLGQMPQLYSSSAVSNFNSTVNNFFTSPGGGCLNLRGIGCKRTLTLLNGHRVVASSVYGGPDVNLFPKSVLKSVEMVTGGASAAWGTDAVAGVANFMLDTEFDGIRGHAQLGQTSRGDNQNSELGITLGHAFGERAHLIVSVDHYEQDPVYTWRGRDWYQGWGLIQSTAAGAGSSRDNPRYISAPYVTSINASYDGVILGWQPTPGNAVPAAFGRMIFDSSGQVSPFQYGSVYSTLNGAQTTLGGGSGTDNGTDRPSVQPSSNSSHALAYFDVDVADHTNVYLQGLYGRQTIQTTNLGGILQPGTGQPITIYANNAFLPDSVRQAMAANNLASFSMGRIGHSSDIAGNSFVQQDTKIVSGTLGFKSNLESGPFDGWTVDGYYQYGRTNVIAAQIGGIRVDRLYLALDAVTNPATGATVCNVTLVSGLYPDCVPLNLFGRGNASQAAIDWVTGFDPGIAVTTTPYLPGYSPGPYSYVGGPNKLRLITIEQHVVEAVASGEVWEGMGAGAMAMAFGAHYRRESVDQRVQASQGNPSADPFARPVPANNPALGIRGTPPGAANNSVEFQFSKVPFLRGAFDVKELFTEVNLPLLADKSVLQRLDTNAAVRWAYYGGSGAIWSYKAGLDAQFGGGVRLRGTYSRDVRAANLGERFDRTGGAANITDFGLAGNPTYPITVVQGGNPNVSPEKADTVTVGAVYRPGWLSGLSLSVDWLSVTLKGSIESFTAQQIINACYQQGNADQCRFIERNPSDNRIFIVNQSVQNVSEAKISGIDIEAAYTRRIDLFGGGETLGARLFVTYLGENSTTGSTGIKTDRAGETGNYQTITSVGLPEWKATAHLNYTRGPFSAFAQARFIDSGMLDATYNRNGIWDVANNSVSSIVYLDARLAYRFDVGSGNVEVYANGNNLADRVPPIAPFYSAFSANPTQANTSLFDVLGRRFTVGFKLDF
ncbi:MAG: TonB-dependent receptor [Gammaproteobacteria bacterium]|nr:TonB-dependent receptor [Gammaproteobacteria bacterium]